MHIGKRLAMLNPKNCRFDIGSGGIPDLVATDVAAALGMVAPGIGREMLCRVWWPDGAKLSDPELKSLLDRMIREEWARRESSMLDALLAVAARGNRAQGAYSAAHVARWPRMVIREREMPMLAPGYNKVRDAVINELAIAGLCPSCQGRGHLMNEMGSHRACGECNGEGHLRVSDRARSEMVGVSWTTYRSVWQSVYEWTLERCNDELHAAERQFNAALS